MKLRFLRDLRILSLAAVAAALSTFSVSSAEREPLLAGANDTYVAISTYGCMGKCQTFDLYVFPNGHLIFRGHKYTARIGVVHRTVSRQSYERIRSFLETHEVFKARAECKEWSTDHPGLNVFDSKGGVRRESHWYWGSECDLPMVDQIYHLFIMETNTPRLVSTDTRYWQQQQRKLDKEASTK